MSFASSFADKKRNNLDKLQIIIPESADLS